MMTMVAIMIDHLLFGWAHHGLMSGDRATGQAAVFDPIVCCGVQYRVARCVQCAIRLCESIVQAVRLRPLRLVLSTAVGNYDDVIAVGGGQ